MSATTPTSVSHAATTTVTPSRRPIKRRWWFVTLSAVAAGLTGMQVMGGILSLAEATSWRPTTELSIKHDTFSSASLKFSPTRNHYVAFDLRRQSLKLVDRKTGEILWKRPSPANEYSFNLDGTLIFFGNRALDAATGKVVAQIPVPEETRMISWSATGNTAAWTTRDAPYLHLWSKKSGKVRTLPTDRNQMPSYLTISPDGRWLSYVSEGPKYPLLNLVPLEGDAVHDRKDIYQPNAATFSPDSKILLFTGQKPFRAQPPFESWRGVDGVRAWSTETGKLTFGEMTNHMFYRAYWSQDGRFFATSGMGKFAVFEAKTGKQLWSTPPTSIPGEPVALTPDKRLYFYETRSLSKTRSCTELKFFDLSRYLPD